MISFQILWIAIIQGPFSFSITGATHNVLTTEISACIIMITCPFSKFCERIFSQCNLVFAKSSFTLLDNSKFLYLESRCLLFYLLLLKKVLICCYVKNFIQFKIYICFQVYTDCAGVHYIIYFKNALSL